MTSGSEQRLRDWGARRRGGGPGAPSERRSRLRALQGAPISPGVDDRVTKLEVHMDYARANMDAINSKLDTLIDRTRDLPTKRDLTVFNWQTAAMAVALMALIVGGIIGGLSWIQPEPAAPSPIVVQMPASVAIGAARRP